MNVVHDPEALCELLDSRLDAGARTALRQACTQAAERCMALYLVGGSVRDLVLGRPSLDLDLAVEGDAAALAQAIAEATGTNVVTHREFGTATVAGAGWRLDFARTRAERYPRPGALPRVCPASIEEDLKRRDFAAHAIALRLAPKPPVLLDPFGGLADIEVGRLRVLHERSFRDDPTRILRLARYAARFGWAIEPETDRLAQRDGHYLERVSGARIAHELVRTFAEEHPEAALRVLARYDAAARAAGLLLEGREEWIAAAFAALRARLPQPEPRHYLAALAAVGALAPGSAEHIAPTTAERAAIRDVPRVLETAHRHALPSVADPVALTTALDRLNTAAIAGVAAALAAGVVAGWETEVARFAAQMLDRYLQEWRTLRPRLTGDDLLRLGIPRGPAIGATLRLLRAACIRGEATTIEDEARLVATFAHERQQA